MWEGTGLGAVWEILEARRQPTLDLFSHQQSVPLETGTMLQVWEVKLGEAGRHSAQREQHVQGQAIWQERDNDVSPGSQAKKTQEE